MNRFLSNSRGQSVAEYIIIVIVIAIGVILAVRYFGSSIKGQVENVTGAINGPSETNSETNGDSFGDRVSTSRQNHDSDKADKLTDNIAKSVDNELGETPDRALVNSPDRQSPSSEENEGDALSKQVKRYARGVGDAQDSESFAPSSSFGVIGLIAASFVLLGFIWGLVKAFRSKGKKKNKRKRRGFWFFTLGNRQDDDK